MSDSFSAEKIRVARASVFGALILTGSKLAVGISTGSLGVLSEAAHSGLDLIAAGMTWMSVIYSDRPADEDHPYGHYKIDNMSALLETVLLLLTCVWIIYEAINRLFFKRVEVEVNVLSFGVIVFAIIIDYTRGRALARVAKKTGSAALEADALHFTSDIASSAVVLAGLAFTWLGYPQADAICSVAVAFLVMGICYQLGRKAIDALLDRVPRDHVGRAALAAGSVPEVHHVYDVRVRHSGARHFVDLKVVMDRGIPLDRAHEIAQKVEIAVKSAFPDADVVVHAEPDDRQPADLQEAVFFLADRAGLRVHSLQIQQTDRGRQLEMHLETAATTPLGEAHHKATGLEEATQRQFPELVVIRSHLECIHEPDFPSRVDVTERETDWVSTITRAAATMGGVRQAREVQILDDAGRWYVGLTCRLEPRLSLHEAHEIASRVEQAVQALSGRIVAVNVHTEPVVPG